ncbi:glycosyltransferase family 4 protein [Candidatus Sumerlaeota bacterium]|nr:glycosyltransferase family 4 protein [Candidatus Sumerlaeota bacterium]
MRILFVTHRFGKSILGGAERHLWSLARELVRAQCRVDVATTAQSGFSPFLRFGLRWSAEADSRYEEIHDGETPIPIRVFRFPVRNVPKPLAAFYQKHLQHRWEAEELAMEPSEPLPHAHRQGMPLLLTGWHLPEESEEGRLLRWTMGRAAIQIPPTSEATLHVDGVAPQEVEISLEHRGEKILMHRGDGRFEASAPIPASSAASVAALCVSPTWRPWRDARTLGVQVSRILLASESQLRMAPLQIDHRVLRAHNTERFIRIQLERAARRPPRYSWVFDQLRGPRCRGLTRFLGKHAREYDWVVAGCLPFCVLPEVVKVRRSIPFLLAVLPLFHVDDDYYYWRHYVDAMREADVCLANSAFSHRTFFPAIQARSISAGAGVSEEIFRSEEVDGKRFRKRFGFAPDEKIVLSVGRKSGPKLYRILLRAVDSIQNTVRCRLVLVGPDEDQLPINSPNCSYLGALSQRDLIDAYDACNVFCLMSESESFGMVFLEAWMRSKPVIGNRTCAPVASLIQEDETGLLASNQEELEECLVALLRDPQRSQRLGEAGLEQTLKEHTWSVITRRILDYFESAHKPKS